MPRKKAEKVNAIEVEVRPVELVNKTTNNSEHCSHIKHNIRLLNAKRTVLNEEIKEINQSKLACKIKLLEVKKSNEKLTKDDEMKLNGYYKKLDI